jgi:hypothetical protein
MATRTKHNTVAGRRPGKTMAGGIELIVGFGLNNLNDRSTTIGKIPN